MHLFLCLIRKHDGIGSGERGIANISKHIQRNIREHADIDCILHIDAASDTSGHINAVDHGNIEIHGSQHGVDGGENRTLGTDKVVNIHLGNLHILD